MTFIRFFPVMFLQIDPKWIKEMNPNLYALHNVNEWEKEKQEEHEEEQKRVRKPGHDENEKSEGKEEAKGPIICPAAPARRSKLTRLQAVFHQLTTKERR